MPFRMMRKPMCRSVSDRSGAGNPHLSLKGPRRLSRREFSLIALAAGAWNAFGGGVLAAAPLVVSGVRLGSRDDGTRLVLDLSASPVYSAFNLADPFRMVFDFPGCTWQTAASPRPVGLIRGVRVGAPQAGTARMVLDLSAPAEIARVLTLPPQADFGWRFVVDLRPTAVETFMAKVGSAAAGDDGAAARPAAAHQQENAASRRRAAQGMSRQVIVIDPGHGGIDPGAIGVGGVYEKHITLAAARQVKARLEKGGRYQVVLTRDRDVFISLRDRVAIARKAKGDLFISLHADSNANHGTRGLSVYTLSEKASDREAGLLADKENKADIIAGMDFTSESPEVTGILIDLAQRESMNLSAQYAALLVGETERRVRILDNTHRFAGFAVLKAPDIPSVLMEMGYLSNPAEERLLQQASYRDKIAEAVARSVDRYFSQTQNAQRP